MKQVSQTPHRILVSDGRSAVTRRVGTKPRQARCGHLQNNVTLRLLPAAETLPSAVRQGFVLDARLNVGRVPQVGKWGQSGHHSCANHADEYREDVSHANCKQYVGHSFARWRP